jgi:hypothetical protein
MDSADVVKVAWVPDNVPVPMAVPPSRKVTVPVGVPPVDVTVAVNVTDWPITDGFGEEVTVVVVSALFTVTWTVTSPEFRAKVPSVLAPTAW